MFGQYFRRVLLGPSGFASGFLAALLSSTALHAADFTIVDGQTETTTQNLGDNETGTIQSGGQINTNGIAVEIGASTNVTVVNDGTITTTAGTAYAIHSTDTNVTVTNNGTISTVGGAAYGIYTSGTNATLTNSGTISTTGNNGWGIRSANDNATITNSGTISTTDNFAYGIRSNGGNATITHSGTITTRGGAWLWH